MDGGYFYSHNGDMISVIFDELTPGIWSVAFKSGNTFKLTGRGDEYRILATIVAITKEWASLAKPLLLTFSSSKEDNSRMSAYAAIVKRFIKDTSYKNITSNIRVLKNENLRHWVERAVTRYKSMDIFVLARTDQI